MCASGAGGGSGMRHLAPAMWSFPVYGAHSTGHCGDRPEGRGGEGGPVRTALQGPLETQL